MNYDQAVEAFCGPLRIQKKLWNEQRSGAFWSLNQMAIALGVQMIQDLVAERLQKSTWTHVEFDNSGHMSVINPEIRSLSKLCPLCKRAGLGDVQSQRKKRKMFRM